MTPPFAWIIALIFQSWVMRSEALSLEGRRKMIKRSALVALPFAILPKAVALDMDAFMQEELTSKECNDKVDKKCQRNLSADEALCRFGQPSPATGQACVRANVSPKRQGGVDAFGNIDRGDYVRCKPYYVDGENGFLVKKFKCE
mmetsp:Transcript_12150/g.18655  ORF Transcript_12150/g.18655 Transcript_12150/m.18655 type:complete len:145 (-) Transcript_12150:199-633(-)|eukprot:CAMPEP_0178926444 /NCGR_PEP_ID=MMETSP0786-20121207/18535_1 /TAXON_ID=186022 /ORGANISM="Thalassionema frauenfeldii, Strain CCMP 1798" /LENGTH=144 /DNA_ID=CAMNT_0020601565 /DNA_START=28 /DNA_END=462 /DNA_ORIENTATION=-